MDENVNNHVEELIGDTPVSVQLAMALEKMASREDVNTLRNDIKVLSEEVERLIALVGDLSVSEQISLAISKSEN